jgi:predicted lipid-binding transport protein (Tim44 family)
VSTVGHGQQGWPFGFEVTDFLAMAQKHFLSLQEAWDRRDLDHMQDFLSPTMLQEVKDQFSQLALLDANATSSPKAQGMSEVLMLDSQCLSVKLEGLEQKVSVELSGMIREGQSVSPNPFREIWTWSKTGIPRHEQDLQGWRVSALEALQ